MNKKMILPIAASLLCIACGEEKASTPPPDADVKLLSLEQKVSYIIGYDNAKQIRAEGFALDPNVVYKAVIDANAGLDSVLSEEEVHAAMKTFQTQLQEKHQDNYQQVALENQRKGQEFLQANAGRNGVVVTPTGLQYEITQPGQGASPKPEDTVTVNYTGKFIDGKVFDAGQQVSFQVNQLIPAWVEALPMMKVGGKWTIFVPPSLAYGEGGTGGEGGIGPNSTLMFDMELLSIDSTQ